MPFQRVIKKHCNNVILVLLIGVINVTNYSLPTQQAAATPKPALEAKAVIEKVQNALVLIITLDNEGKEMAQASGFSIGNGLFATNLHVFKWAYSAKVKFMGSEKHYALDKIVGVDIKNDLCVFKILSIPNHVEENYLVVLPSPTVNVGDAVIVGGNPKGLEGTFSKGIISGIRKNRQLFQIDASISHGSSGGPVVNENAEVIGIATSSLVNGQNLNFAVNASLLFSLELKWSLTPLFVGLLAITDVEYDKLIGAPKYVRTFMPVSGNDTRSNTLISSQLEVSEEKSYDITGNTTQHVWYIEKNHSTVEYGYSENGLIDFIVEQKYSNGPKNLRKFNDINAVFERCIMHVSCTTTEDKKTYDCWGNLISVEMVEKKLKVVNQYDSNNRVNLQTITNSLNELVASYKYTYENDSHGNWIKQYVIYINKQGKEIGTKMVVIRTILYY